jgi:hypothetical protein
MIAMGMAAGGHDGLMRPALRTVPNEPDQVPRLQRYRAAHPDVAIAAGEFGTWQALIPEPAGETVITRHRLRDLLDKLDELAGG